MNKDTDTTNSANVSVPNNDLLGDWIPTATMQPEWNEYVLVCRPCHSGKPVGIGRLMQQDCKGYGFKLDNATVYSELCYACEYWMPLPSPPNAEVRRERRELS